MKTNLFYFAVRLLLLAAIPLGSCTLAITYAADPDVAPVTAAGTTAVADPAKAAVAASEAAEPVADEELMEEPWDFSPYRVLVWVVSNDPAMSTKEISPRLQDYLDRQFAAIWRVTFESAPASVASVAGRSLAGLDFETISAADSVIAVKRNSTDAPRMRTSADVSTYTKTILSTPSRTAELKQRVATGSEAAMETLLEKISDIKGDALDLERLWADESTEAMLTSRGMALTFSKPEAKVISPPVTGSVADSASHYDKIFVVKIDAVTRPMNVQVVELDTLMKVFGPVVEGTAMSRETLVSTIGSLMIRAFAPVVRIDDAGDKNAVGLLRAGGLILDEDSPANIRLGDVLIPMIRKDDRNGKPIMIGPIPWAVLVSVERELTCFATQSGLELQVGDRILRINGALASDAHLVEKTLHNSSLETIPVEVQRGDKTMELQVERSKLAALRPSFFGFVASDRGSGERRQLIVTSVLPESVADGKLKVGDVILSAASAVAPDLASLRQLVATSAPGQAVEFSIKRGEATVPVSIVPSDIADLKRRGSSTIEMDFYSGRGGGLQGRSNKRTFRMALLSRPYLKSTMIRMHVRGRTNEPLIGYEIYEKAFDTKEMTFIGRTDWNGRIWLEKSDYALRLLYVKNGGAVLARLPIVPGQSEVEIADMTGDDMRLQAEAYILGVQNAIVDLIAIRELLAARVRLRLKKGEMKEAEELLEMLRKEPTNEKLADDMGKKQTEYLKILGTGNANQRKMIDQMFTGTRELLSKHISPKLLQGLEDDMIAAKKNGGKLPEPPPEVDAATVAKPAPSAVPASDAKPAAE